MRTKEERDSAIQNNRLKAAKQFYDELESIGGCYTLTETAKYLNVSVDDVSKMLENKMILGFSLLEKELFPKFQFQDGAVINAYKTLIPIFNVSSLTATSFMMTGYVARGNDDIPYYEAMKKVKNKEFEIIQRDAKFFGSPTPN